ncbi:MAG: hypothetical protein IJZ35_04280 [Clostridia bacterium]|nr:hypothetical protein [Clostridia bacterium]
MFSNLKAKKRITQLLIAIVVVALTATGSVFLLNDFVQEAKAADYTVNSAAEWNSAVTSGNSVVNITLGSDIALSSTLSAIPSGVTVNLYMNGKTIQWYNVASGDKAIITLSYPFADTYWGMITNNGTLNITGTGVISQYQMRYDNKNSDNQENYGHKSAAIVNSGTLTIGSGITVENYACQANTEGTNWQDMFIYSHAVYNTGTVNTSGTIQSGSFAMSAVGGNSSNSFAHAYSYGIFGGVVNVTGGNIFSEAKSGFDENSGITIAKKGNKAFNMAVGVYSNNALIYGNSAITTNAASWRDDTGDMNVWSDGWNMSWGVGVLYAGTNYPYIGADVNINASFTHTGDSKVAQTFPSLNGKDAVITYTRQSGGDPGSAGRRAYAVAGIPASNTTAMAGLQTSEVGPETALGVSVTGSASSTLYRSELAAYNGLTETVNAPGQSESGANSGETKNSYITMGAPGSKTGGQYMVYYRYRNANGTITSASYAPNTAINSKLTLSPSSGVFTQDQTSLSVSGGDVTNSYYYNFLGTYYRTFADGAYGTGIDCSNVGTTSVTTKGTSFTDSFSMTANNSYVIWVDYQAKNPTNVKVVAATKGNDISKLTTSTTFETTYTGKALVPGTDFNLGVIDMIYDTDVSTDDTQDNIDATSFYAVSGVDNSKVQLTYSYSTDGGTTWKDGLPKDVGTYTIKVVVPADTDINRAGSGNRNGGTFTITGTIKQATPTVSGATTASGTYGSTMAELIDTAKYTVAGQNGEVPTGTWTYSGYTATQYPNAGSQTIILIWTPSGDSAVNYKSVQYAVTLTVAKRDVTVAPADSTVTYGAKTPTYVLNYTNLASCDDSSKAQWLADTTFEVYYNGSWQAYSSTMVPGTYDMRIATFGGDTTNNNFTTSGTAKLTINKAPIYYTAAATNKTYDGKASVDVALTYAAGVVNGDSYSATLTTTGTLANANAGENKAVTVVTSGLEFINSEKYYIAIQNNPTVTVSKATPTATPEKYSYVYNADRTLAKITLTGETTVTGVWSWKDSSIVPTVDVTTYTAIFTPTDTTNYNTIEVPVTINISKAEVTVSVDSKTIAYGDATPALTLVYTGWTGSDSVDNVATTGTIAAETTYSMGKEVGTYPITINAVDYEAVNYSFKLATDCTITVEKKNVTITAPSGSVTYGDADLEFTVDDLTVAADSLYGTDTLATLHAEAQFAVVTAYEKGYGVGSYEVTVSANETKNYSFTFVKGYITVNKAVLTVTADDMSIDYGKQAPDFKWTVSGYKFDSDAEPTGKPALTSQYIKGDNAGEYAITITVGTLEHDNYTFKVVGGTLTVNKLTLDTTDCSVNATITHDEAYSEAVFTDTSFKDANDVEVAGTFALKNTTTVADYTTALEDEVTGDKYVETTAIFTPTDSDNYNAVEVKVYLYINLHSITGAPVITGTAMDGNTITASVAGMAPSAADSYTYVWYVGGTQAGTGATYTVKETDIDKAIYVIATADTTKGYTGSAQSASVTAVKKFDQLVSADQLDITGANSTHTYDGSTHGATVTVKSQYAGLVGDDITVYYNGSTSAPYKAGSYIVTIDVAAPEVSGTDNSGYYGPVSGLQIGTITIEKATVNATFTVADKIYDGTRKVENYNVVTNGMLEEDAVYLDASAISIVFNKAAAGEQVIDITGVKLSGDDASNYTLVIDETKATIEQRTLTAVASGVTRAYNGSATVDVTFSNITGYASIDSASTVYFARATAVATSPNAGTQGLSDIRYELGGTSANNYVVAITNVATAQVTITKAVPGVTPPTVDGLVYNANRTLANIDLEAYYTKDSNGYWQFDDTSIVPTVKKTQYAATYISTNSNYADYNTTITVNVTPKTVTLTAVDTKVSYGKAATYSVKADGFTGNDSLATMGGTQPTYVCTYTMGENVGTYNIKLNHNLDSNGNYEFVPVDGTLTVVPADLYVAAAAVAKDYDGTTNVVVNFSIVSGKYSNDDVALSTTAASGTASSANAGTRTVVYTAPTLIGSKASNYNLVVTPASGILTVTINKLDPEGVVFPKSATIEFGRELSWAEFSDDAAGDGEFTVVGNVPNALGSYPYTVVFTPSDSVNYNTVEKVMQLEVTICTTSPVIGISGTAQSGQKLSVVFTGLPTKAYDYVQYQWFRVSDTQRTAISGATASTYTATEEDVGCKLVCVTYFEINAPFQYNEDLIVEYGSYEGLCTETEGSVEEENLTFWQRLIRWIQSIIEALTGITFIMGG